MPSFSALMTSAPARLIVPPMTLSPGRLLTGMGSPVIRLSSTADPPSITSISASSAASSIPSPSSPTAADAPRATSVLVDMSRRETESPS